MSPTLRFAAIVCLAALPWGTAVAQQPTAPVYRVPNQPAAQQPPMQQPIVQQPFAQSAPVVDPNVRPVNNTNQTMPPGATRPPGIESSPFNIYTVPGEHPLMPCVRLAKQGLQEIEANIQGYTAVLTKQERIDGKVGPPQQIQLKVRHEPLAVHVKFIQPYAGREVLYNAATDPTKLTARESRNVSLIKHKFGKVRLKVDGAMAMAGQRYPITNTGMKFLTAELLDVATGDLKYGECNVTYRVVDIGGRPCTELRVEHPVPRRNFRFNIARIFIDHELRIPTGYDAYTWPAQPGGQPQLEESYFHTNVVLNPTLTESDFDVKNPNLFQ